MLQKNLLNFYLSKVNNFNGDSARAKKTLGGAFGFVESCKNVAEKFKKSSSIDIYFLID